MEGEISRCNVSENTQVLRLSTQPGIADIAELHRYLNEVVVAKDPIIIEAGAVEQIDGAVLQLLMIFHQTVMRSGICLCWQNPSQTLLKAADLSGLRAALGLDSFSITSADS